MASVTLRSDSCQLPASSSLNCGVKVKWSCRMKLAVMASPPVRALSRTSAHRALAFSCAITALARRYCQLGQMPLMSQGTQVRIFIGATKL